MPYRENSELPPNIKRLPVGAQTMFRKVFNSSISRHGEVLANKIAWAAVKTKFKRVGDNWVAKGMGLSFFTFSMTTNKEVFVKKGADGEYYLEATLSDNQFDSEGRRFTSEALQTYANQINTYGIAGFITHRDWDDFKMANSHLSEEEFIRKARTERKGILKTVKAIYEKGKLWIKALIDKRYINHVKRYNKVSIEALVPTRYQTSTEYRGGYALGFALDNNAINPRATAQVVDK
jgi:cation transport regulator